MARREERLSVEDHGFVAVAEDAVLKMPTDGAGKNDALEIAAAGDEVFDLVAMRDAGDVLFDDGAVVEFRSDVVACGANEFNSAGVGGVIGAGSDEGG